MKLDPKTIDISIEELEKVVDGARHQTLSIDDHRKGKLKNNMDKEHMDHGRGRGEIV
jgi:hypothetical protein